MRDEDWYREHKGDYPHSESEVDAWDRAHPGNTKNWFRDPDTGSMVCKDQ